MKLIMNGEEDPELFRKLRLLQDQFLSGKLQIEIGIQNKVQCYLVNSMLLDMEIPEVVMDLKICGEYFTMRTAAVPYNPSAIVMEEVVTDQMIVDEGKLT